MPEGGYGKIYTDTRFFGELERQLAYFCVRRLRHPNAERKTDLPSDAKTILLNRSTTTDPC